MNHLEQRFINHESSEHEFQYRIESGPSPAAWSGLHEFDLVMTWSCQPAPATKCISVWGQVFMVLSDRVLAVGCGEHRTPAGTRALSKVAPNLKCTVHPLCRSEGCGIISLPRTMQLCKSETSL